MDFRSPEGADRYAAVLAAAAGAVVGLDFDGVLSPIVEDPTQAVIHPDGPGTLVALAEQVRAIAVITGRPARQALVLGELDEVGNKIAEQGNELFLLGQYGNERWTSYERRVISPRPPQGLAMFMRELPQILAAHGADGAFVEEKGLAVAVHTRRLPDPAAAFASLLPALEEPAERHGLTLEPGRLVVEIRAPGMHKGDALRGLISQQQASAVVYAGDDLGDVEAFRAVAALRDEGLPGLLVCSGSQEQEALVELADLVVDGPAGVMEFLGRFTRDAAGAVTS